MSDMHNFQTNVQALLSVNDNERNQSEAALN